MVDEKVTKKAIETLYSAGKLPELEALFKVNKLSPKLKGMVRGLVLTDLLATIESSLPEHIQTWLDSKGTRLDKTKLAAKIGFGCERASINQSFKTLVVDADERLNLAATLTTRQIGLDNITRFEFFLKERLDTENFQWPVSDRNKLYHKRLYMNFLDDKDNIAQVTSAPGWFYNNDKIKQLLADIDVLIVEGKVKSLSFASECALDEMSDSMTSQKVKNLLAQLNEKKTELAAEREARRKSDKSLRALEAKFESTEAELRQYKKREQAIYNKSKGDIKIAGAH